MATVRIYKVAELLGTTSQEVSALLKRDHGIEVKSASSTIEEVVARQFVERLARQRNISLPGGDMFAETPVVKGKKGTPAKKAPEPPKPSPSLPPPRLVKTVKPPAPAVTAPSTAAVMEAEPVESEPPVATPPAVTQSQQTAQGSSAVAAPVASVAAVTALTPSPDVEPAPAPAAVVERPPVVATPPVPTPPVAAASPVAEARPPVVEPPVVAHAPTVTHAPTAPVPPAAPVAAQRPATVTPPVAVAAPPTASAAQPAGQTPQAAPLPGPPPPVKPGRVVPPTLRLRIEEQRPTTPTPPLPTSPVPRVVPRPAPRVDRPGTPTSARPATAPGHATTPGARPGSPAGARPGGGATPSGAAGVGQRAPYPSSRPQGPVGGPRPLPSQPIRAQQPGTAPRPGGPPRPAMPPRPPMRPQAPRPSGPRRDQSPRPMASAPLPASPPPVTRSITLAEGMTVKDLAEKLEVRVNDLLAKLLMKRLMLRINSTLDTETATMIAREFGADVQMQTFEQELLQVDDARPEDVVTRAPVVTVMGHVDHGKTSLLDAIRETRVAEREAGGITQHIGAYHVTIGGRNIVFLDTPGHEAFTLMRARGAKVTDIVILVVAADDGVMPQTKEAIDHAKAAGVPIIVAINKIDKQNANSERVKRELTELDLMPEEWGGRTVTVEVSAKKKQNIELLLEMVLLVSDIGELKANPKRNASGTVLEAKLDKGRGPVATILVQDGTLRVGDTFIAGPIVGRVRALIDDRGRSVKAAPPSTPVEVLGLAGLPQPGDAFQALADAAKARQIATFRQAQAKERALGAKGGRLTLESLQQQIAEGGMKELPIIIKADVQGSAEVLADTLTKLSDEKVKIRIIHAGVGAVNESDVLLASASNAIVIGFNVRPDRNAQDIAEREHVEIRQHSVIYNVTDEMKKAMAGLLEPTFKEVRIGVAEVRNTFKVPKYGTIAGCMVVEGRITRAGESQARLVRDNVVVYEGKIGSLRRFKDDVSEVKSGIECGIGFERFNDIKLGDVIEVFTMERVAVTA